MLHKPNERNFNDTCMAIHESYRVIATSAALSRHCIMVKALASCSLLATLIGAFFETARPGRPTNVGVTSSII